MLNVPVTRTNAQYALRGTRQLLVDLFTISIMSGDRIVLKENL